MYCSVVLMIAAAYVEIYGVSALPTVRIEDAVIKGAYFTTHGGRSVHAFLGVPYATPPVGHLRFHHPLPAKPLTGIVYANETKEPCLQYHHLLVVNNEDPIIGSEDCLYLNIFTPRNDGNKLMEVLVFIHGGAFMFGKSDGFKPSYLLDKNDLVFVTITYRVGPLGFLSTEDDIVPGNNGLKDQVMALKWINQNIRYFGGNPKQVTIAGLSAGAVSVHLHYFSPLSVNLFTRGISLSGSALCPWAQMSKPKQKAVELAKSLNCPTNETRILIDCLRNRPGHMIISKIKKLFLGWLYNPISPFGPTVEVDNEQQFLSDTPYELIKSGKVQDLPWLVGFTKDEGLYPASEFILNQTLLKEFKNNWSETIPHLLNYNFTQDKTVLSKKIKNFYLNKTIMANSNTFKSGIIKMISDRMYVNPIAKAIQLQSVINESPVYLYNFAYRGKYSCSDLFTGVESDVGVSHGDDAAYTLNCYFSCTDNAQDKLMVKTMVNIWSNYITNNKPHNLWKPVDRKRKNNFINFLYINSSENLFMSKSNNLGNGVFWDSLKFTENVLTHDEL